MGAGVGFLRCLFPPPHTNIPHVPPTLLYAIRNVKDATFVSKWHRAFGSPPLPTFLKAIRLGWITVPGLTGALVSRNPPLSAATVKGHLDLVRQHIRSTRSPPPQAVLGPVLRSSISPTPTIISSDSEISDVEFENALLIPSNSTTATCTTTHRSKWAATDLTGRFPCASRKGNEYILVTVFHGYTCLTPQPNKSATSYVKSFKSIFKFFADSGHPITELISDNESSELAREFFRSCSPPPKVQYVAPNNHRANFAERFIRTAKNHIISCLTTVHCTFPLDLWDEILPTIELTLNHLLPWRPNPAISAYHGLHGLPLDFNAHPIFPVGQLCYTHESPLTRATWASHASRAFYISPALSHYRCHTVHVVKTAAMRVSDTLSHFPDPLFHFEDPAPPAPSPPGTPSRPNPTPDGSDMIGKWFNEPEEGICEIISTGAPYLLEPDAGNRHASSPRLAPGWHYTVQYRSPSGSIERASVTEVADWLSLFPYPGGAPPRRSPRIAAASAAAPDSAGVFGDSAGGASPPPP